MLDMLKVLSCGAALMAALAGIAAVAQPAPSETVAIDNFMFSPTALTVPAGTHVVFVNRDDLPHTVVIPDLKQKSGMLDTDGRFEAVLDTPGEYVFFCSVHPRMTGKITVTENNPASSQ